MKKPTKIWFENDILMYDAVFDGITPQYIKLDTTINNAEFDGKHVYIKGTPHDAIIHDLDNHLITTVRYKAKSIKEVFSDKPMNRMEEIKKKHAECVKEGIDPEAASDYYEDHVGYLLNEVERLTNELDGRNERKRLEWELIIHSAKLGQSFYTKRSLGWLKFQKLIDRYEAGERTDQLREEIESAT